MLRSSGKVSVHAVDNELANGDGFAVLPTSQLGTQYYVASYKPSLLDYPSFFCISSLYSKTSIYIKTPAENEHQVILEENESYRFDGSAFEDLSGTLVQSDKPIAVISGVWTRVPENITCCAGGLLEQLPPVHSWGYNFILSAFLSLNSGYVYRVYAVNMSVIQENGISTRIAANSIYETDVTADTVVSLTSDHPIMVVQYMKSNDGYLNEPGGPSMLIVQPITSFTGNVIFPVIEYTSTHFRHTYYINIVIDCEFVDGLLLDDSPSIRTNEVILKSRDESMCCLRTGLSSGHHTVSHNNPIARFFVCVYGISSRSSYAYAANVLNSAGPHSSEPRLPTTSYLTRPRTTTNAIPLTTDSTDGGDDTGIIVGGVAGAVVLICIIILILLILYMIRSKQRRNKYSNARIDHRANHVYETQITAGNINHQYDEINDAPQEYAYAYADDRHQMIRNDDGTYAYAYAEPDTDREPITHTYMFSPTNGDAVLDR
ncbi:uncharacterized protein [Amphiura filiformis]|uniref:uncharacterized protein n=1 Tax=Amphiura filiformis TaxID=82378 RepID=UPI003B220F19